MNVKEKITCMETQILFNGIRVRDNIDEKKMLSRSPHKLNLDQACLSSAGDVTPILGLFYFSFFGSLFQLFLEKSKYIPYYSTDIVHYDFNIIFEIRFFFFPWVKFIDNSICTENKPVSHCLKFIWVIIYAHLGQVSCNVIFSAQHES